MINLPSCAQFMSSKQFPSIVDAFRTILLIKQGWFSNTSCLFKFYFPCEWACRGFQLIKRTYQLIQIDGWHDADYNPVAMNQRPFLPVKRGGKKTVGLSFRNAGRCHGFIWCVHLLFALIWIKVISTCWVLTWPDGWFKHNDKWPELYFCNLATCLVRTDLLN